MTKTNVTPGMKKAADAAIEAGQTTFCYRGRGYVLETCQGAAHSNPWIDNCTRCAPMWGVVIVEAAAAPTESETRGLGRYAARTQLHATCRAAYTQAAKRFPGLDWEAFRAGHEDELAGR